jgi:hypothetical protein
VQGSVATIVLAEGEDVICTFFNAPLPAPELDLSKTADAESFSAVGDQITYTYALTNTGNTILGPSQFFIDDDKINGGNPFDCGAAATTLEMNGTVTCTAVYTVLSGDLESGSITNSAFGQVGELTSPTRQVTVTYIPPATTTTIPIATTTIPAVTTTLVISGTTIPEVATTIPIATTTIPAVTTTVVAPSTTAPSEFQVVNPNDPTGTEDVLDVLFPDELPVTGGQVAGMTLLAGLVLLLGVGATTVSSHRRQRRNGGR